MQRKFAFVMQIVEPLATIREGPDVGPWSCAGAGGNTLTSAPVSIRKRRPEWASEAYRRFEPPVTKLTTGDWLTDFLEKHMEDSSTVRPSRNGDGENREMAVLHTIWCQCQI